MSKTPLSETAKQVPDDAERWREAFLSRLSHELRNPLAPLSAALHLLRAGNRRGAASADAQALAIIERQIAKLGRLAGDLSEMSRALSGRMQLTQEVVDLNPVVARAVEAVMPLIDERRQTLTTRLCERPVWVNADPIRLQSVFVHLMTNAAAYTPEGGRLDVRCGTLERDDRAEVRVRDNGVGIDRELLPHIFDRFLRTDPSMSRSAGGLGLGLSLAHRIVEMHGGTMEATSPPEDRGESPAGGTEMVVRLACVPAPAAAPGTTAEGRRDA